MPDASKRRSTRSVPNTFLPFTVAGLEPAVQIDIDGWMGGSVPPMVGERSECSPACDFLIPDT